MLGEKKPRHFLASASESSQAQVSASNQLQSQFKYKPSSRKYRPSFRGESNAFGIGVAPFSIFESQAIPVNVHNFSKSFRPHLATITLSFLHRGSYRLSEPLYIPMLSRKRWSMVVTKVESTKCSGILF